MAKAMEYATYLSREIGARPTGTEEEQQAALYIADQLQKQAGLPAVIEDFNSAGEIDISKTVCYAVSLIITLLAVLVPALGVAALVLTLASALVVFFETRGTALLSRFFNKGISQNVVAKYIPHFADENATVRNRKIVIVSHYDSARTRTDLNAPLLGVLPLLQKITFWAVIALPLWVLIRFIVLGGAQGGLLVFANIITILFCLAVALYLVFVGMYKTAKYNDAANCNASGVGVMMEVAQRVNDGVSAERAQERTSARLAANPVVHGEEAAVAAGLVPENAEIVYDVEQNDLVDADSAAQWAASADPESPESSLLAAKAAIAAMTGKPVRMTTSLPRENTNGGTDAAAVSAAVAAGVVVGGASAVALAGEFGDNGAVMADASGYAAEGIGVYSAGAAQEAYALPDGMPEQEPQRSSGVPDWFKKAKANAKKPADKHVARSRYNDALAAAEATAETEYYGDANQALYDIPEGVPESIGGETVAAGYVEQPNVSAEEMRVAQEAFAAAGEPQEVASVEQGTVAFAPVFDQEGGAPSAAIMPREEQGAPSANRPVGDDPLATQAMPLVSEAVAGVGASAQEILEVATTKEEDGVASSAVSSRVARPITLPSIGATGSMEPILAQDAGQRAPLAEAAVSGKAAARSLLTMLPSIDMDNPTEASSAEGQTSSGEAASVSVATLSAGKTGSFASIDSSLLQQDDAGEEEFCFDDADESAFEDAYTETGAFAGPGYVDMPKERRGLFGKLRGRGRGRKGKKAVEEVSAQEWLDVDEDFDAREVGKARGGWESFREDGGDGYAPGGNADNVAQGVAADGFASLDDDTLAQFDAEFEMQLQNEHQAPHGNGTAGQTEVLDPLEYNGTYAEDDYAAEDEPPLRRQFVSADPEWGDDFSFAGEEGSLYDDEVFGAATSVKKSKHSKKSRRWNGGAFGRLSLGRVDRLSRPAEEEQALSTYEEDFAEYDQAPYEEPAGQPASAYDEDYEGYAPRSNPWDLDGEPEQGAYTNISLQPNGDSTALSEIFDFHSADINTEVWFVALGSQHANNSGMKAFLNTHRDELRGAIIIELDAMGAGDLSFVASEGKIRSVPTSSRMRRYVTKAAQNVGMRVGTANIGYASSASSYASANQMQAMHLAGMSGGKMAFQGQSDDVVENLDEAKMVQNTELIMELLRSI